MAISQVINVIVNSRGAVVVKRQLQEIGDTARSTTTYLNGLRAILSAALTFSGAQNIMDAVDTFTVLQNRLRQVADESSTVEQSWRRLIDIANDSYSSIDNTVNLYFRVAQAFKSWGENAKSAYEFTELFQKAAVLSGSTMQTTSQAVYQFSQALNKGKLDGDEFRSVLEGLPYVAQLIQKELGVTRSELYELSKNGKITVDRIRQAFMRAADTIRSDWSNITPTIGMALVVLKNRWIEFIGDIQTSTGIFSGVAQLILLIADNFDILAIAMTPVAAALAFMAGRMGLALVVIGLKDMYTAIKAATTAVWAFNAALMANPLGLILGALALVVTAIIYFRNELGLTDEVLKSVWEGIKSAVSLIGGFIAQAATWVYNLFAHTLRFKDMLELVYTLITNIMSNIGSWFGEFATNIGRAASSIRSQLVPLFTELKMLVSEYFGMVKELTEYIVQLFGPAYKVVEENFKKLWDYMRPAFEKIIAFTKEIYEGWVIIAGWLKSDFAMVVKDVFEGWILIIRTIISGIREIISVITKAIQLMKQLSGSGGGTVSVPGANYGAQFYAGEFNDGGGFKVPGTNAGRDSTPVAFRANRGERVTVETKKQQRVNDRQGDTHVNVPVQVNNIIDPSTVVDAVGTYAGARQVINVIRLNREEVLAALGSN